MKLFYSPGACALGVQIVLREAGLKFDMVKTDLKAKTYDGGDFRAINPKGYVPTIQLDNGEVYTEGAIILQVIADKVPDKKLLPKLGTPERYRAMEWLNFVSTELHKGIGSLFNTKLNDEARASILDKLAGRFTFLNEHLKTNNFILGSEFSAVDAYVFNMFRWANPLKIDLSPYPAILALMERVGTRPTARASIEAEGLKA